MFLRAWVSIESLQLHLQWKNSQEFFFFYFLWVTRRILNSLSTNGATKETRRDEIWLGSWDSFTVCISCLLGLIFKGEYEQCFLIRVRRLSCPIQICLHTSVKAPLKSDLSSLNSFLSLISLLFLVTVVPLTTLT